jgi:hypothetical protein
MQHRAPSSRGHPSSRGQVFPFYRHVSAIPKSNGPKIGTVYDS